jgi:ribonuclease HI
MDGSFQTSASRIRGPSWFLIAITFFILTNQTSAMKATNQPQTSKNQTYGKQEKTKTTRSNPYSLPVLTDTTPANTEIFYTDGGCKKNIATWSFVGTSTTMKCGPICLNPKYPNIFYHAETHSSNTAEITAAIECLNYIIKYKNQTETPNITIFLDSANTLMIMTGKINPKHNVKISRTLQDKWELAVSLHPNITPLWLPGHEGILGNELADHGTNLAYLQIFSTYQTPYSSLTQDELTALLGWTKELKPTDTHNTTGTHNEEVETIRKIINGVFDVSIFGTNQQ